MRVLLILTAILALAGVGCAGSTGEAASGGAPLTGEQYTELERLYRAQVAAERLQDEGRDRKAVEAAARACAAVPDGDALLTAVADVCGETVEGVSSLLEAAKADCHGRECAEMTREMAAMIDAFIATARRGDEAVAELVRDEPCQEALSTPPEVHEAFRLLSEAFGHLHDGLRTQKEGDLGLAKAKLEKGEARFEDAPSAREALARFRDACSP